MVFFFFESLQVFDLESCVADLLLCGEGNILNKESSNERTENKKTKKVIHGLFMASPVNEALWIRFSLSARTSAKSIIPYERDKKTVLD